MSRIRSVFVCRACGAETPRWEGRCPTCGEWNSLEETNPSTPSRGFRGSSNGPQLRKLGAGPSLPTPRITTGIDEVDRVLGGGLVPGSVVLLGGAPGIGKSTLLLQIAGRMADEGSTVLYVSGEESAEQISLRAARLGVDGDVTLLASQLLDDIVSAVRATRPAVICVDSIQTIGSASGGAAGGVAQVRDAAAALQREAKQSGAACFLVGHVTKGGAIAGPRTLEHLVDVVLHFEGHRSAEHRVLRGSKNRFGSVDELAAFRMHRGGLSPVPDPSTLFLSGEGGRLSGAAVAVPLQGSRPIAVEVQALVARARFAAPQRVCTGFPPRRLAILLAVLERRAGVTLGDQDVFLNVVGGLRMMDPAADLAVVAALLSAGVDRPWGEGTAFFGEVGLGGEVRAVSQPDARMRAAATAGLQRVISGPRPEDRHPGSGRRVRHVRELVRLLDAGEPA